MQKRYRLGLFATAVLFATTVIAAPALPDSTPNPAPPAPSGDKAGSGTKSKTKDKKKTEQQFRDGYRQAYDLIQGGRYAEGIAALHALEQDAHPDVANYIGFASRKLGRYEDAKVWYEKALAADPKHVRTWQYYGMWHVEQGNLLKAQDYLQTINVLCGSTECKEYKDLQGAIEGTVSY